MLDKEYYKDYTRRFNAIYKYLLGLSDPIEKVSEEICSLRKYTKPCMRAEIEKVGFIKVPDTADIRYVYENTFSDLGLCGNAGEFLLSGRYIFPVRDMMGNVIALIGWFPDEKRYITTPSALFSKSGLFFGMEQLGSSGIGSVYFLVEGIFDSLALRSLGYRAVAQMGISSSKEKEVLYGLFRRLIAIPDADERGREVLKGNKWKLPNGSSYLAWSYSKVRIKDVDDLIKYYDDETLKSLFDDAVMDTTAVITYKL